METPCRLWGWMSCGWPTRTNSGPWTIPACGKRSVCLATGRGPSFWPVICSTPWRGPRPKSGTAPISHVQETNTTRSVHRNHLQYPTTLLRELPEIPEHIHKDDFVLHLSERVSDPDGTTDE